MMIMIKIISQNPKYAEIQILILKWLDAWHFGKGLLCLKWKIICRHTQILHFRSLSLRKKGPFAQLRGTISGPLRALKDFQMRSYLLKYKLNKIYICFWAKYLFIYSIHFFKKHTQRKYIDKLDDIKYDLEYLWCLESRTQKSSNLKDSFLISRLTFLWKIK